MLIIYCIIVTYTDIYILNFEQEILSRTKYIELRPSGFLIISISSEAIENYIKHKRIFQDVAEDHLALAQSRKVPFTAAPTAGRKPRLRR